MRKLRSVKTWLPIKSVKDGVIETKSGDFCKVVEVYPINFMLKSITEQEAIIYQYKAFLRTCNFDMQILVKSEKGDLSEHISEVVKIRESSPELSYLINEYINTVREQSVNNTIIRRFYIVFKSSGKRAIEELNEKSLKIKNTLEKCGVSVKECISSEELFALIFTNRNAEKYNETIAIPFGELGGSHV